METRAKASKRIMRPLQADSPVVVVDGDSATELPAHRVATQNVGHKAFGLAALPSAWTKPFFVVSGDSVPPRELLQKALSMSGIPAHAKLFVRSSGTSETIESRGELQSAECSVEGLRAELERLQRQTRAQEVVHWVIQEFSPVSLKGHLSNERRVAEDKRDWMSEIEAGMSRASEIHRIPLRDWRDKRLPHETSLVCAHREAIVDRLAEVARWTYQRLLRVHFEWVWDGQVVYLVQADPCDSLQVGRTPHTLVNAVTANPVNTSELEIFRAATPDDFARYRKLANVKVYGALGYEIVPFFVLDLDGVLREIVESGTCSDALRRDLERLTHQPLVIRTDGADVPSHLREMLPRSDELRSGSAAVAWLLGDFKKKVCDRTEAGESLSGSKLCLIAHHFVPACAAAWCQASPNQRKVRIESLWGIPEGLYWYAYDVFDVDTQSPSNPKIESMPVGISFREKRRYKEHFIAPDEYGAWVVHRTSAEADWVRSIKRTEWIHEIAWTSRCIAAAEGKPVVVMWLIDTARGATPHHVLPWFHTEWKQEGPIHKAAPRKKLRESAEVVLRTRRDWDDLKAAVAGGSAVARIRVDPSEPEMVRDQKFVGDLGSVAKHHGIVVELSGGILSHAYYMLSRAGCDVECADLDDFAVDDEAVEFNKLVRDGIPAAIVARGESVALMQVKGEALIASLRRKLVEEALEVLDARSNDQIVEELADVSEVVRALMTELGIAQSTVETARREKSKKRGAFKSGIMLGRTAIASPLSARLSYGSEMLPATLDMPTKTITRSIEIPSTVPNDVHVDLRHDAQGAAERQLTVQLPIHAEGLAPPRVAFSLPTLQGEPHEMSVEVNLERTNGDLRVRLRLRNAPEQLSLDFDDAA